MPPALTETVPRKAPKIKTFAVAFDVLKVVFAAEVTNSSLVDALTLAVKLDALSEPFT